MKGVWIGIMMVSLIGPSAAQQMDQENKLREQRLEEMERIDSMRRRYENDREGFIKALAERKKKEAEDEAQNRLNRYANNKRVDTLKVINLNDARLSEIPSFVFEAVALKVLRIEGNSIKKLPKELKRLKRLEKIFWSRNEIDGRPKFVKLNNLKDLRMNNNGLEKIPSFRKFKSLTKLELAGNQLSEIPISTLRKNQLLTELVLRENPLVIEADKYHKIDFLTTLKINKCGIKSIDPSLYQMKNLDELQMQENELVSLPDGISEMEGLSKLSLYKNEIQELPSDIFELPELVVIDLYYNELEKIPSTISNADQLEILFLAHNKIYDVPNEVGELTQLRELYLHHNRISAVPGTFSNLKELRVFRINHNYLSYFPEEILKMGKLTDLDLEENDISSIPTDIEQLEYLSLFTFDGNEINFEFPEHADLANSIVRMMERGVVCKPSISREYVDENGNKLDINTDQR